MGRDEIRGGGIEAESAMYEINKLQGYIVQHRIWYFITINGT